MAINPGAVLALLPVMGIWPVSGPALASSFILTLCTSFVLTGIIERGGSAIFAVCFALLFISGLYSNSLSTGLTLPDVSPLENALVFAIPGQLVMGFLLYLIFGFGAAQRKSR